MPSHRLAPALAVLALLGATAAAGADRASRLDAALQHPGLRGAQVGALVVRLSDGATLYERAADRALMPASNLKILTALAALDVFGPAHQFTTRVLSDAPPGLDGSVTTLAVRGGGDPALTSEQWWRLAADLRRLGLRRVRGDLLLDDSHFDQQRWNPAWGGASARAFHAPVGALNANYGAFAVEVRPGNPPRVTVDPDVPYLQLVVKPTRGAVVVDRQQTGDRERVVVSGSLADGSEPAVVFRSVADPLRYAAALLRLQLAANGIQVDGRDRFGPVPAGFTELLAFQGEPLVEIVRLFMKHSNNNIAESLVKSMGAYDTGEPGTWENGLAAMRRRLAARGIDLTGCSFADGSGLSPSDRVTPSALVAALRTARAAFAFGPEFVSSLPIAGRDGTLSRRAADAEDRARAKTGLINGAAALSGYAITGDGTEVAFSILVNGYKGGDAEAVAGIDRFLAALAQ